jgi:hypothetical protein
MRQAGFDFLHLSGGLSVSASLPKAAASHCNPVIYDYRHITATEQENP